MNVEEITDFAAFLELEPEWNDLSRDGAGGSFFLSHAWFRCCWLGCPGGWRPTVLTVRDGAALTGVLPLLTGRSKWRVFPIRVVSLMQNQDSPFAGLVLRQQQGDVALRALLDHLSRRRGWDVVALSKIVVGSDSERVAEAATQGWRCLRTEAARSPVLTLDGNWDAFWKRQSQRFKKTIRNTSNRIERLGRVTVEDLGQAGASAPCTEVFRAVAGQSWKADLPTSVTRNVDVARFFGELTEVLLQRGQLALWVLRLDGVPIATEYHVRDGDAICALRSDFVDTLRDASPGAYLNYRIIRTYFDQAVRRYDMGPGDSEYKARWTSTQQVTDTFWLFSGSPYATGLYELERRVVPRLRRLRRTTPARSVSAASAGSAAEARTSG